MRKDRDREACATQCGAGCLEIRTLISTMLAMGFLLVAAESALRYIKLGCPQDSISVHGRSEAIPTPELVASRWVQPKQDVSLPSKSVLNSDDKRVLHQPDTPQVADKPTVAAMLTVATSPPVAPAHEDSFSERRQFRAYGSAAHLFVEFGTYRGGRNTFAVVGLASKPLHVYGKPGFECEWIPSRASSSANGTIKGNATKMLPDWGYGRVYTVVVVNCTFDEPVGTDAKGGELILHATHGDGYGKPERIVALRENAGDYDASLFEPPYPYDFLYCGSSLFGNLNPQRVREWMAYHVKLFGPRSHFVFHDTGGVHPGVRRVLEPWMKKGFVTVQNITQQEQYDGYYYNQFLIVNDCLHRTRFLANWTFFFDVDEYIYVPPQDTLLYVMDGFSNYTQITYEQSPMSEKLCLEKKKGDYSRDWGFEKLVFRNVQTGIRWDRKYAIQARNVFATGVHMSENMVGKTLHTKYPKIKYYHYHNTITNRKEVCQQIVTSNSTRRNMYILDKVPYKLDTGMAYFTKSTKEFELQQIGKQPIAV